MTQPDGTAPPVSRVRLSDLSQRDVQTVSYRPDAASSAQIAARLDLIGLRKARLDAQLVPVGRRDWDLLARLGATVVQPCVTTLKPVTTRIDEDVVRRFREGAEALNALTDPETEMPEDDTVEPLPDVIDLAALFEEALALALPAFPRAPDAALDNAEFAAPGETPLTDADVKPFAGLAGLRRSLDEGKPDNAAANGGGEDAAEDGDDGAARGN